MSVRIAAAAAAPTHAGRSCSCAPLRSQSNNVVAQDLPAGRGDPSLWVLRREAARPRLAVVVLPLQPPQRHQRWSAPGLAYAPLPWHARCRSAPCGPCRGSPCLTTSLVANAPELTVSAAAVIVAAFLWMFAEEKTICASSAAADVVSDKGPPSHPPASTGGWVRTRMRLRSRAQR